MKKIVLIIVSIVILTINKAQAFSDRVLINETINDYNILVHNNNYKRHMKAWYLKSKQGDFLYCIEPKKGATALQDYNVSNFSDDNMFAEKIKERINLIAYYGYQYGNHQDKIWYIITQLMIWKTVNPELEYTVLDKNDNPLSYQFQKEKGEIEYLLQRHFLLPTFNIDLNNLSIKNNYKLLDVNNVLNEYSITNNPDVKIENNYLLVNSDKEQTVTISLNKRMPLESHIAYIYKLKNKQTLVTRGSFKTYNLDIKMHFKSYFLNINKFDIETKRFEDNNNYSLKDTEFELYKNNSLITKFKINDKGQAIIENLGLGDYTIKEIKSGKGYKVLNKDIQVKLDKNRTINIYNYKIKKKIKIKKYKKDKNTEKLEPGASFEIVDDKNKQIIYFTTNENGEAEFELPFGTYILRQLKGAKNYTLIDDYKFQVNDDKYKEIKLYDIHIPDAGSRKIIVVIGIVMIISILIGENIYEKKH